jgi:hypothetical protein
MAEVIDITAYIERAVRATKSGSEGDRFVAWAVLHLDDVAKRFGCDISNPEAVKGFRVGAQWALDLQEKHEREMISALRPRWHALGAAPLK